MIGQGQSVGDAALLISVLVAWNYVVDFLSYHVRFFEWLTDPPPLCLIRDGRLLRRNMRREHLTDTEIEAKLRGEGIDDVRKVRRMFLESDGSFSVLRRRQPKA
jgi:uncharacterized membrane protein YcaP (DUF421 family)